jgi:hypothetical protein
MLSVFANVNFIDIAKISREGKFIAAFKYLRDNQNYYDHWTYDWSYDIPKKEIIKQLRQDYSDFATIATKSVELFLLLGDISHYLYNLDDTAWSPFCAF